MTGRRATNGGYTISETLLYVAFLTFLLAVIINMFLFISTSYRHIRVNRDLEVAASTALERLTREARNADTIGAGSVFDSHPGTLVLSLTNSVGLVSTVSAYLDGDMVMLAEGAVAGEPLLPSSVRATSLVFRQVSTPVSTGVRIELTLEATSGDVVKSESFVSAAMLRGSY